MPQKKRLWEEYEIVMSRDISTSIRLFEEAEKLLPGGVSSPVRAFRAVGGRPLFIERGEGAHLFDVDGNRYVDYVLSWGPLILGHAHPSVVEALNNAVQRGTSYGAPIELEIKLATKIQEFMPAIEMLRFVNSGTEATMSALRLARAFTGRNKIIKFEGCYHGHADLLLVRAGSGVATLGLPDSPGVPEATVSDTLVGQFNDAESVEILLREHTEEVAALIVEPVAGNMGVVPPIAGFLERLREMCDEHGVLLIFDEVMTGFRVHPGGAQALYRVTPDLTTLGKVIGGGLPVGAYGGRKEVMEQVAPLGDVYQAGTLSGNPLAMAAGLATLTQLQDEQLWAAMQARVETLSEGIFEIASERSVPVYQTRVGTMFSTFFTDTSVQDWSSAQSCDLARFAAFFHSMLSEGVYIAPSQFEAGFMSTVHNESTTSRTLDAVRIALGS